MSKSDNGDKILVDNEKLLELVIASSPEMKNEITEIWEKYNPKFHVAWDKKGFFLEGGPYGLVMFTKRTLFQIWLLIHAAYRSLYSYGDVIYRCQNSNIEISDKFLSQIPGQNDENKKFDIIIDLVFEINDMHNIDSFNWPNSYYNPLWGVPPANSADEIRAIYDLTCISMSFAFLHEIKHIINIDKNNFINDPLKEELDCDGFAQNILLKKVDEYCKETHEKIEEVVSKRAASIAIVLFIIAVITSTRKNANSHSHPSIKERIEELIKNINLPNDSYFWVLIDCLLVLGIYYIRHAALL